MDSHRQSLLIEELVLPHNHHGDTTSISQSMTISTYDHDQTGEQIPIAQAQVLLNESATSLSSMSYKDIDPSFDLFWLPKSAPTPLVSSQIQDLKTLGFPTGLAQAMNENNIKFPLRVWVIDNSGSMKQDDGSRLVGTTTGFRMIQCTRWIEMQETVQFHAKMASIVQAPTVFRLLNRPLSKKIRREFRVDSEPDVQNAIDLIKTIEPKGCTPLAKRVWEIRDNVQMLKEELEEGESRIAIVLATDGLPTNGSGECTEFTKNEFVNALKSLEGLPIWLVIRLCTQQDEVVQFYNDLDAQLELELEVLDDFFSEAKEIYAKNKWINYALPLHRAREMGFHHRLFDLLDERRLTLDEVGEYFKFLFGTERMKNVPHPAANFKGFLHAADRILESEPAQYNPIAKKDKAWVDLRKLAKTYKDKRCSVM